MSQKRVEASLCSVFVGSWWQARTAVGATVAALAVL